MQFLNPFICVYIIHIDLGHTRSLIGRMSLNFPTPSLLLSAFNSSFYPFFPLFCLPDLVFPMTEHLSSVGLLHVIDHVENGTEFAGFKMMGLIFFIWVFDFFVFQCVYIEKELICKGGGRWYHDLYCGMHCLTSHTTKLRIVGSLTNFNVKIK